MKVIVRVIVIVACTLLVAGCSSTAKVMVAQPAVQSATLATDGLPAAFKGRIVMRCVREEAGTCIYSTVFYDNAATFSSATATDRNALAYVLLTTANDNCSWFLNRVFANRTGISGIRDAIKNLATGAAALTAKASPGVSAGLGFANLFADSSVKALEANEYASKTYDAIESAISKQRNDVQTEIVTKLTAPIEKYSVGALLLDVSRYKNLCTITSGIKSLQDVTKQEEQKSETKRKAAEATAFGVTLQ
jgi:hypothetical protein